jgi:hypothetical protein
LLAIDRPIALQAALEGRLLEVITNTVRPPLEILAALPGVEDVQSFGERAHVRVAEGTQAQGVTTVTNALKGRGIDVLTARPVPATLEDVFIALITADSSSGGPSHSERPS